MFLVGKIVRRSYCVEAVKSFDQIPGPKGFLGIGNLYNYSKTFGKFSFDELDKNGLKKYAKYGPIVCERMIPGVNVVWIYDPKDIALVMNEDPGQYPRRRSHLAVEKYRLDRPEIYSSAGLFPTNGEEWWKLRSQVQQPIAKPQNVRNFLPTADKITREFLNHLPSKLDEKQEIKDAAPELLRVILELTCSMIFDESVNAWSEEEMRPDSMTSKLIEATYLTNSLTLPLDQGLQLWRFFETPMYRQSREAQDFLGDFAVKMIAKLKECPKENSLLGQYLANPNLTVRDIHSAAVDLLLGSSDTTGFTLCFSLHHIARDPKVQDLMYEEAMKVLPNENDSLTAAAINSEIPYTRAVLKECLRLNPISVGVGRNINKNLVLSGYLVPKDTTVVTQNQVSCRLEKYFHDPLKFKPERWLKDADGKKQDINPYLSLPFGHGMRSCIARRFAEQNLLVLMLRMMRVYKLEWRGCEEPIEVITKTINVPSSEISLKFIKR